MYSFPTIFKNILIYVFLRKTGVLEGGGEFSPSGGVGWGIFPIH